MSYVLLARECLSYPRWYAMHSNELQTGYRESIASEATVVVARVTRSWGTRRRAE